MNFGKIIISISTTFDLSKHELTNKLDIYFYTINRWENKKIIYNKIKHLCSENKLESREYHYE